MVEEYFRYKITIADIKKDYYNYFIYTINVINEICITITIKNLVIAVITVLLYIQEMIKVLIFFP